MREYIYKVANEMESKQKTGIFNKDLIESIKSDLVNRKNLKGELNFGERKLLNSCEELLQGEVEQFKKIKHLYLVKG